ncbi:hypothetical protein HYR99_09355 [Candidatus Poribacteria bacterium]|nr:hypothetical protein [Candidatus Poribacteria bacterium]
MKRMNRLICCVSLVSVIIWLMGVSSVWANHNPPQGPTEFNGLKFKIQDLKKATEECDAGGKPLPEFVPTVRDGEPNLALLEGAKAEASSVIAGWCPKRHCTEFLNDGFYNNCRSWIIGALPGWAQIDIGRVTRVNRVFLGSDHSQGFNDRAATDFAILVATATADPDSNASTWKSVLTYKDAGKPIRETTEFTFAPVQGRWVRIQINGPDGTRIDEVEIYGGPEPTSVEPAGKLTTTWGQIKRTF